MNEPTDRLGAIARWLQQVDDELLYTPDGEPMTIVEHTGELPACPDGAERDWDALASRVLALHATARTQTPDLPLPFWQQGRRRWGFALPHATDRTRDDLATCFRVHEGMRLPFLCEIPLVDEGGPLLAIRDCRYIAEEHCLVLLPLESSAWPAQRWRVRFAMDALQVVEYARGLYTIPQVSLVEVWE